MLIVSPAAAVISKFSPVYDKPLTETVSYSNVSVTAAV